MSEGQDHPHVAIYDDYHDPDYIHRLRITAMTTVDFPHGLPLGMKFETFREAKEAAVKVQDYLRDYAESFHK